MNEPSDPMTPAREALLAYARAWTYPVIGNEDVPVMKGLFEDAARLAQNAVLVPEDPPMFAGWLKTLHEERQASQEWEDALFAMADYFGLSTDV
jgi:hypothetical protein